MKLRTITTSAAILALLTSPLMSMASTSFDQAQKEAVAEIDKAKAAGYEWRDSRGILKKAEAAEKAGDHEKALKLAKQAKKQGIDAVAQSKTQTNAGPH
jgi:hypothetical protein